MGAFNRRSAKTHSGIWRDLAVRKRHTEIDAQIGPVVEIGARRSVPTPLSERLIALMCRDEGFLMMTLRTADEVNAAFIHAGTKTEAGFRLNIRVGVQYIEAWLRGRGAEEDLDPELAPATRDPGLARTAGGGADIAGGPPCRREALSPTRDGASPATVPPTGTAGIRREHPD